MVKNHNSQGFTLIELMIVVAIIAIIAAIAVPNLLSARLAANESNAISTLRNLVSAQAQFQQSGSIDADQDGTGEYGFFGDLAGAYSLDSHGGPANANTLQPPVLPASFRAPAASGVLTRGGYCFLVYLPDSNGLGQTEDGVGNALLAVADADNCELAWACYAWPANLGNTGNRAFFVNQQGEILFSATAAQANNYDGAANAPGAEAAFAAGTAAGDIMQTLDPGNAAADGAVWVTLQ